MKKINARNCTRKFEGVLHVFLCSRRHFEDLVIIEEGTGDNLLREEIAAGYVDYVNYDVASTSSIRADTDTGVASVHIEDGGMILLKRYAQDMTIAEIVNMVLDNLEYGAGEAYLIDSDEDTVSHFRLHASVLFNRSIDSEKDSISPGGYEMTFGPDGKTIHFDFEESEMTVDKDNPHILRYMQKNPDHHVFPGVEDITSEMLSDVRSIDEWYIDTESDEEDPLIPIAILDAFFTDDKGNAYPIDDKVLDKVFPVATPKGTPETGDRVWLIDMPNDPRPVPSGTEGIVRSIDDAGHIHVMWDNGQGLSLIPGVDRYLIVYRFADALELLEDEISAEGAWSGHAYGLEVFRFMPEYAALKIFIAEHGIGSNLDKAESEAIKEFEAIRNNPAKSFLNESDVRKLELADRLFIGALKTACRQADAILMAREV